MWHRKGGGTLLSNAEMPQSPADDVSNPVIPFLFLFLFRFCVVSIHRHSVLPGTYPTPLPTALWHCALALQPGAKSTPGVDYISIPNPDRPVRQGTAPSRWTLI